MISEMEEGSNASVASNVGIDQLVKQYLRAKGYESAAAAMEQDMNRQQDLQPSEASPVDLLINSTSAKSGTKKSDILNGLNLVEAVYIKALHDNDFTIYMNELDLFSSWVFSSFDAVKNYLLAVLFAIFSHW